ncbi:MAG: hypothetical protein MUC87_21420, partial [Bacteroidia bacterium]|nr:hypothetical protein [Bacteroidia bacterium]
VLHLEHRIGNPHCWLFKTRKFSGTSLKEASRPTAFSERENRTRVKSESEAIQFHTGAALRADRNVKSDKIPSISGASRHRYFRARKRVRAKKICCGVKRRNIFSV